MNIKEEDIAHSKDLNAINLKFQNSEIEIKDIAELLEKIKVFCQVCQKTMKIGLFFKWIT